MKYRIRIKATAAIAEATWAADKYVLANGTTLTRDEADLLEAFSVEVQVYEWYGNDGVEPNDAEVGGRYKPKGSETFIVYLTEAEAMYGGFEAKLEAQLMKPGRHIKYSLRGSTLFPYYPPTVLDYSAKADAFVRVK
jgi:hypothetical protein